MKLTRFFATLQLRAVIHTLTDDELRKLHEELRFLKRTRGRVYVDPRGRRWVVKDPKVTWSWE